MNKRKLHHIWTYVRIVRHWHFLFVALVCSLVAFVALRQNNLHALQLREEVLAVDQANGDVEAALRKLRTYVYGHMNTNLASDTSVYPPIQLKFRYERLVQAEKDRVSAANGSLYNDAQAFCERTEPQSFFGAGRLDCVQRYVDSHQAVKETPIPDGLYKFDFASPRWSPDLAGFAIIVAALFWLLWLVRFGLGVWVSAQFKHHS